MLCLFKDRENIVTKVHRKLTNNVPLNRYLFVLYSWKQETLKTLVQCTYIVFSTKELLNTELGHSQNVFVLINNYPKLVITNICSNLKYKGH